jgi:hypothetical protein
MYVMYIYFFSGCFYADSRCNEKVEECDEFDGESNINLCVNANNGVDGGIILYSILFYSILFYFIFFILLYSIVFYCILFYFISFYFISFFLFYYIL